MFKHYPLSFHKNAHLAHQASIEAYEQGKFWPYHDLLFANQRALQRHHLDGYARQVGLDMDKFRQALDTQKHKTRVDADINEGNGVGVQGTPSVFINGQPAGAFEFAKLKAVVDPLLIQKGYKAEDLPTAPRAEIKVGKAVLKGDRNAPITIAEFSDFECPFCSTAARQIPQLVKMYPKQIRVAFKHFPLSFHKKAHLASQASLAAGEQGKFWEYHDHLFANQSKLDRADLMAHAKQLGLNVERFQQVLDSGIFKEDVDNDLKEGQEAGVQGTPSFFVNGVSVTAGASLKNMVTAIEKELKRLKLKSPVSAEELKKLGVDLSEKPEPRPLPKPVTVPSVVIAPGTPPPTVRPATGQCKPGTGTGGTQCIPPSR